MQKQRLAKVEIGEEVLGEGRSFTASQFASQHASVKGVRYLEPEQLRGRELPLSRSQVASRACARGESSSRTNHLTATLASTTT